MFLAQPKINLRGFKSTPDSLKHFLKSFERKRSLGAPDLWFYFSGHISGRVQNVWQK